MGLYDFDEIVERRGSGCVKYDAPDRKKDNYQLWVADMDFKTPDFILDALKERLAHPVLGYPVTSPGYFKAISDWLRELHGLEVEPSQIRFIPGIVRGIAFALNCFLSKGDKVIIQPPVYHPFRIVSEKNGFELMQNPLLPVYAEDDGRLLRYRMDYEGLERLCSAGARALVLSNPHNPCGISWSADELSALARITSRYGVIVLSDEIHCEMVLRGGRHNCYLSCCPEAASNGICFMAPSKTFNVAGVVSSYCFSSAGPLRSRFFEYLDANELDYPPIFSAIVAEAAYTRGRKWRSEMLRYVEGNIDFIDDFLRCNLPSVKAVKPDASFLVWLDCRALGLTHKETVSLFEEKAHLSLNDGAMFGPGGEGYMRLNAAHPRSVLKEALQNLVDAVNG